MPGSRHPLLSTLVATSSKGRLIALPPTPTLTYDIFKCTVNANGGGAFNCGIMRSLSNYKFYSISSSGKFIQDFTQQLQAGQATSAFDTLGSDGFLVGATQPIGLLGMNLSSTQSTSGQTISVQYYNGTPFTSASSGWTGVQALSALESFPDLGVSGDRYFVQLPAADWVKGAPGYTGTQVATGTTGTVNPNYYYLRVTYNGAPPLPSPVTLSNIWLGQFLSYQTANAAATPVTLSFSDNHPLSLDAGDSIFAYLPSGTSGNNTVGVQYGLRE